MCKSHRIESFLDPLLSNLFVAEDDFHKNNRGDVILSGLDETFILLDVLPVDPFYVSNERLANSEVHNPLLMLKTSKSKNTVNHCPNGSQQHSLLNLLPRLYDFWQILK
ncbi:hypothetical protein P9112_011277 [Eukaryota sp. TZLM1-RC]